VQRAYRARLAAAGKVVRTVDAGAVCPTPAGVAQLSIPEFDPAKDGVFERQMVASTRDQLHKLSKLELRGEEVTRLRDRTPISRTPSYSARVSVRSVFATERRWLSPILRHVVLHMVGPVRPRLALGVRFLAVLWGPE